MPAWMRVVLSSLLLLPLLAMAKPQVLWLYTDWPPHQIVSGPFKSQGTFDKLLQQILPGLPGYSHQTQMVSLARLEQQFQQRQYTLCTTGTLFTEARARDRYFSLPMAVGPGIFINYLAGSAVAKYQQADGSIDLQQLAADPLLVGAYQPSRYYAPVVMQVLAAKHNLLVQQFTSELNAAMLLQSRRVDYVLEYPERMQFYALALTEPLALNSAEVALAEPTAISHISCTKTAVGQQLISEINQLLPLLWQQASYTEAMQHWLDGNARQRVSADIQQLQQASMQFEPGPDNTVEPGNH